MENIDNYAALIIRKDNPHFADYVSEFNKLICLELNQNKLLGGSLIGSRLFMPLHHANVCTAYSLDLPQLMIQAN